MTTREEALVYGLSFQDTYQDAPFHDTNWQLVRYKGNKKAFLWIYERNGYINLNVKADPVWTCGDLCTGGRGGRGQEDGQGCRECPP